MTTQYTLQIAIADNTSPEGAVGVLLPVPPTTPHQQLQSLVLDPGWKITHVTAQSGVQSAIFATMPTGAHQHPIVMNMVDRGTLDEMHFEFNGSDKLGMDVLQLADDIGLPQSSAEADRLERIVDTLAGKFSYKSGYTNDAPLTCDILTGNCLSINDAFLKLTQVARIKSAYYIGYFFQDAETLHTKDWHCWVGTLTTSGYESWDIAHHLKRGMNHIASGLNPVPGVRFATSVGRDLVFNLPFADVAVPHLCEPHWVFKDGTSTRCDVRVTLEQTPIASHIESFEQLHALAAAQRDAAIARINQFNFLKALAVQ